MQVHVYSVVHGKLLAEVMAEAGPSRAVSLSPPSTTVSVRRRSATVTGRPRKSVVWDYFEFDEDSNKSVCQIILPGPLTATDTVAHDSSHDNICGHSIAGKFPTNLKQHLKKAHPRQYSELL